MNESTERSLSISCDDCSMQCSAACGDCLVTFLLRTDPVEPDHDTLVLSLQEARVVKMFGDAGLVPDLKFRVAG